MTARGMTTVASVRMQRPPCAPAYATPAARATEADGECRRVGDRRRYEAGHGGCETDQLHRSTPRWETGIDRGRRTTPRAAAMSGSDERIVSDAYATGLTRSGTRSRAA